MSKVSGWTSPEALSARLLRFQITIFQGRWGVGGEGHALIMQPRHWTVDIGSTKPVRGGARRIFCSLLSPGQVCNAPSAAASRAKGEQGPPTPGVSVRRLTALLCR